MTRMKKLLSIVLAITLILSIGILSSFAEGATSETFTITMNTSSGHTYTAYQIFTGDLSENNLSNVDWGNGVNGAGLLNALKNDETYGSAFAACTTAADVVNVLSGYANNGTEITALAKIFAAHKANGSGTASTTGENGIQISGLAAGYYLIVDSTAAASMPDGGSYSDFMLHLVGDISIQAKDVTVTATKKVQDSNDSAAEPTLTGLQDSADYDIGDDIPFTLKMTLSGDYGKYSLYTLSFHDDMSKGLTYKLGSTMIQYGSAEAIALADPTAGTSTFTDGHLWVWTIADLKTAAPALQAGDTITLTYQATLNSNAVIGSAGNLNKMHVEYSNNPNGTTTGKTPDDLNQVFTYQAVFEKVTTVDGVKKHLSGADFALYKVKESITPAQVSAFDVTKKEIQDLIVKSGYTAVKTEGQYSGEETAVPNSVFTFNGIDDGTYVLVETTTPAGYNTAAPLKFVVTAQHESSSDNPLLTALSGNRSSGVVDVTKSSAIEDGNNAISAEIENNRGATLPGTGGIGNTAFYIFGGILVLAAVLLLIRKKHLG